MKNVFKFVETPADIESLAQNRTYVLREKLNEGGKPTREEKDFLYEQSRHSSYFSKQLVIPRGGWAFDFRDVARKFVVKTPYGLFECQAPDKTAIRNAEHGRIVYIQEVAA